MDEINQSPNSDGVARAGPDPKSLNSHSFTTDRLHVGLPTPQDAQTLFDLVGGADRRAICSTLIWDGPKDVAEVADWIDQCGRETYEDWGFHWVIRDRTGTLTGNRGVVLGAIGTRPRDEPGRASVGYWLGRRYWGQGLMGEALSSLIALGFNVLDYYKIEADVFLHNERGRRLVERVGMSHEGVIRGAHRKYGELVDTAIYGLMKGEWHDRHATTG